MKRLTAALSVTVLVAALSSAPDAPAQENVYKWTDAEGTVHYTARPPEGVEYEIVDIAQQTRRSGSTPPAEESDSDSESSASIPPEQPDMAAEGPDPEMVAERCEQARRNIENLTTRSNVLIAGEDGERRQITNEEREQMLQDARDFMDEWC
jgi:hypothetical protein